MPKDAAIPLMMNQSAASEKLLTRGFDNADQAVAWLTATDSRLNRVDCSDTTL
jgi:hypothetical protein